jgi:hypothetical protein
MALEPVMFNLLTVNENKCKDIEMNEILRAPKLLKTW